MADFKKNLRPLIYRIHASQMKLQLCPLFWTCMLSISACWIIICLSPYVVQVASRPDTQKDLTLSALWGDLIDRDAFSQRWIKTVCQSMSMVVACQCRVWLLIHDCLLSECLLAVAHANPGVKALAITEADYEAVIICAVSSGRLHGTTKDLNVFYFIFVYFLKSYIIV